MDTVGRLLADPAVLGAAIAMVAALSALVRAEAARIDAVTALTRLGGRRKADTGAPVGTPERRRP
jgi:hypothetical protein